MLDITKLELSQLVKDSEGNIGRIIKIEKIFTNGKVLIDYFLFDCNLLTSGKSIIKTDSIDNLEPFEGTVEFEFLEGGIRNHYL